MIRFAALLPFGHARGGRKYSDGTSGRASDSDHSQVIASSHVILTPSVLSFLLVFHQTHARYTLWHAPFICVESIILVCALVQDRLRLVSHYATRGDESDESSSSESSGASRCIVG